MIASITPKKLFVCKTGEFTELSILLEGTWTMFRLYHCPTEKMVSWIENDVDFKPQGEEIKDLESNRDKLLACIKLLASAEEMRVRFDVLWGHFPEVSETTVRVTNPPPVMSRHPEHCEGTFGNTNEKKGDPQRDNPTEF